MLLVWSARTTLSPLLASALRPVRGSHGSASLIMLGLVRSSVRGALAPTQSRNARVCRRTRLYSTATPHHVDPASTAPVPILESLTKSVPASALTQESMLLKLEDLVPLPNSFAVVHIGGHQVRLQSSLIPHIAIQQAICSWKV